MTRATPVAIASESPYTVAAGKRLAAEGGNAVDIAVGSAIAATVSEALMCSLGGSAFIHVKLPGEPPELVDGADAMPRLSTDALADGRSRWREAHIPYGDGITVNVGHGSVAVPGMLRALELVWQRRGSLPWREIVAPAVELASAGVSANQTLVKWLSMAGEAVFKQQRESRETFFPDGRTPLQLGEHYTPPHMADTLSLIAREGADALYSGELGAAFAAEISGNGGYVTREDLSAYRAELRRPLLLNSRGFHLALNPPPAIGGAMVGSMVGLYDALDDACQGNAERVLNIANIQRVMHRLRDEEGRGSWGEARAGVIMERAWIERFFTKTFSPNTMHMSVATGDGAVVAITMSNGYGSGISIPGTGIPTNNSLGEPELNPAGYFAGKPGARLISNMAPTVVWHPDGTTLAMGSPGASRITTTILQGWVRFGCEGLGFEESVRAPRLHVEWVDGEYVLQHEPGIDVSLAAGHYRLRAFDATDMYFGALNVAGIEAGGALHAQADTRRHGAQYVDSAR